MREKNHDHKRCILIFKRLSEYMDGELDDKTCQEIGRHMEECIRCKVCLETLKRTVEFCRNIKMQRVPQRLRKRLKLIVHGPSIP